MWLLHTHSGEGTVIERLFEEVLLHGIYETLNILPFLFLTYLLMEFIEHKSSDRLNSAMKKAGVLAPIFGGLLGALPQCGISAAASNFYAARVISAGTLVSVFLSTSDEMLPILISGRIAPSNIALILVYKCLCAVFVGFLLDGVLRLLNRGGEDMNIDAICDEVGCHCERGIFYSALHHTITISGFVLLVTWLINSLVLFVGTERIAEMLDGIPLLSHTAAAVLGLIPNCAVSVALTSLYTGGMISAGTMMAGLFSGAGVGVLVLFRMNKNIKENLFILLILLVSGALLGLLFDLAFAGLLA